MLKALGFQLVESTYLSIHRFQIPRCVSSARGGGGVDETKPGKPAGDADSRLLSSSPPGPHKSDGGSSGTSDHAPPLAASGRRLDAAGGAAESQQPSQTPVSASDGQQQRKGPPESGGPNGSAGEQQASGQAHPAHPMLQRAKTLKLHDKVTHKLANPGHRLEADDQLFVLRECIQAGAGAAERANGKDLLVIIGNTGAGKSTCVNFIDGCKLEFVTPGGDVAGQSHGSGNLGGGATPKKRKKVVRVAEDSPIKELMKIGHSGVSQTFMPEVRRCMLNASA